MILDVRSYPAGPRCWFCGQRVHHGATALVVAAAALARKRTKLAAACLVLAAHDRHDWRDWFRREKLPASTLDHSSLGL
jgi:hypothetical protein